MTPSPIRLTLLPLEAREVPAYMAAAGAYEPNDLAAGNPGVTTLIAGTDDATATVSLGAHSFNFYGTTVNSLVVSTNGLISLGSAVPNDQDNTALTTDPAQAVIAPLWDDWLKTTGQPMVLTSFDGSRLIVEWDAVKSANLPPTSSAVTFQAILELNTGTTPGAIKFNYLDTDTGADTVADDGAGATVGMKTAGVSASSPTAGPTRTLVWKDAVAMGGSSVASSSAIQMSWANAAPVVTPAGLSLSATPITEGGTIQLSGTFAETDVTDGHTVSINWGDGTVPTVFSLDPGVTTFADVPHVYANNPAGQSTGSYSISVAVTDTPGATGSASVSIGVFAAAPALALSVPATVNASEGAALSFPTLATFTSPGFGPRAAFTYSINWGDGTAPNTGNATITQAGSAGVPTAGAFGGGHTYGDDGTYTVTVVAADEDGVSATRTFQVVVADVAPTLSLTVTPPVLATEGAQLSLPGLATFTDPGFGATETFTYSINWGDGTAPDTGNASITVGGSPGVRTQGGFGGGHTYAAAGNYTTTVTVTDDNGGTDTKTFAVAVADAPPVNLAATLSRTTLTEGQGVLLGGTFGDVGAPEEHTLTVDWGDGTPATMRVMAAGVTQFTNLAHTYVNNPAAGTTYTITATVANVGGLSDQVSLFVAVNNVLPTVSAGPALETLVGQPAVLMGSATDPGLADPLAYSWEVFDANGVLQAASPGLTFAFAPTLPGVYTARFTVTDDVGSSTADTTIRVRPVNRFAVGGGTSGVVKVFDGGSSTPTFTLEPYGPRFRGGVRVAVGDVTGDAVPDVITAATRAQPVKVFDGATGAEVRAFSAFGPTGTKFGLAVAAGDVDADGFDDIVVAPGVGGGSRVKVFDGDTGGLLRTLVPFGSKYSGGVRVAAADVTGDGAADVVLGTGTGRTAKVFDGPTGNLVRTLMVSSPGYTGGVWVAAGDLDGDGSAEVIVSAGAGGQRVTVFDGATGTQLDSFQPYGPGYKTGVRVAAIDVDGDGRLEVLTAPDRGSPRVKAFHVGQAAPVLDFLAMDPAFAAGLFIGGGD